jgi:hypothetical protein
VGLAPWFMVLKLRTALHAVTLFYDPMIFDLFTSELMTGCSCMVDYTGRKMNANNRISTERTNKAI